MKIKRFQPCCKQAALEAFQHGIFYLVGCQSCGTCFSITDDFNVFLHQSIGFIKMHQDHCLAFDVVSNGNVVFLLP